MKISLRERGDALGEVHGVEPCLDVLLGVDGSIGGVGGGGGGGLLLGCHCYWKVWMLCGYGSEGSSSGVYSEKLESVSGDHLSRWTAKIVCWIWWCLQ
jgi:hypothetical protein